MKVEGEWNGVMYMEHPNGVRPYMAVWDVSMCVPDGVCVCV